MLPSNPIQLNRYLDADDEIGCQRAQNLIHPICRSVRFVDPSAISDKSELALSGLIVANH
jgi:hypothetical protein